MHDGMTLGVSGFGAFASPDTILEAMGKSFREKGTPRALTIVSGVAPGDFMEDGCGMSKIKDEGIIDTLIASHLRMSPAVGRACSENRIAAYTMPLGVYGQLMAAIGGHRPGVITHVGLHTYADPRQEGCRINDRAKEQGREIVRLMQIDGRDYLFYKAFKIDACILHASLADEDGNISAENEPLKSDLLELASAVHNNGGTVIVEVNEVVKAGSLDPRHVLIHKSSVDYVVRADKQANIALGYFPQMIGDIRMPDFINMAPSVAVEPGHGYVVCNADYVTQFPSGTYAIAENSNVYRVYVDTWIRDKEDNITGANVRFLLGKPANGMPAWDSTAGTIYFVRMADRIEPVRIELPERDIEVEYLGDADQLLTHSVSGRTLTITMQDFYIPGSDHAEYSLLVRSGHVYTQIKVEAEYREE